MIPNGGRTSLEFAWQPAYLRCRVYSESSIVYAKLQAIQFESHACGPLNQMLCQFKTCEESQTMSSNPYGNPMGEGTGGAEAARKKVLGPAIALMVVGVLTIIYSLYAGLSALLVMAGMNPMAAAQEAQFDQMAQAGQSAEQVEMLRQFSMVMAGPGGLVIALVALICGGLILLGAIKMKNLQSRGLAMTAAILGIIPCTSACCLLGIPFGIWGLVVMNDPNVRPYFK